MIENREKPWNKGILVGEKKPYTKLEVENIREMLSQGKKSRNAALFSVGIDSMLRQSDLLSLTVKDVRSSNGMIREEFTITQQKTGKRITVYLFPHSRDLVLHHIIKNNLREGDYLFTGKWKNKPMSKEWLRKLVKKWSAMIGLNPALYSGHSLRRSRTIYLQKQGIEAADRAILLGTTVETAQRYSERRMALERSKQHPM